MSQVIGFAAEDRARDYLTQQNLIWLASNYSCRVGEIDLIFRDGEYIVFVEVRSRSSHAYGGAIESITPTKRRKILKAASFYLLSKKWYDKYPCRFDVLSMDGSPPTMQWIKNAFSADF